MGKRDTIQRYGKMENNRGTLANRGLVTAASAQGSSNSSSALKQHTTVDRENQAATAASSPTLLRDARGHSMALATTTSTTVTTASGSKRPPLARVTNSSTTTATQTTDSSSSTTNAAARGVKLDTNNKLTTSASRTTSPRRPLRSTSTWSAAAAAATAVVTDEESHLQRRSGAHSSMATATLDRSSYTTTTTTKLLPRSHDLLPARGGRCAVYFNKGKDVFGKARVAAGGWYPATIHKVTQVRNRHVAKLQVRFDDGTLGNYSYPSHEVQLLSSTNNYNSNISEGSAAAPTDNNSNNKCLYGEAGQVMFERPTKLQAGDVVFCFFQQGQGFTSDHWYRGRVVATRRLEDFPVCDIAYDDGDFEANVPFTTGVVLKQSDGWDCPAWMVGLEVSIPPKKKTLHTKTGAPVKSGIVKEATPHGAVWIEYDTGNVGAGTSTFKEKRAYLMVAQRLLLHAKEHLMDPKRSFQWPYICDTAVLPPGHESLLANMINASNNICSEQPQPLPKNKPRGAVAKKIQQPEVIEIVDIAAEQLPPPKKKMRVMRTLVKTESTTTGPGGATVADAKDSIAVASNKPPTGRKRAPRGQASTTAAPRRAPRSKATTAAALSSTIDSTTIDQHVQLETELNSFVECVAESDWSDSDADVGDSFQPQLPTAACSTRPTIKEIQVSLGSSLVTSVNSSDPHLGVETLMFMAIHHKQMPGQRVRQALLALLTHGPMSGKTAFDDCHRMTLAEQYVSHCLTIPGMADHFAIDAGPSYWSDCLTNLTALYYCAPGDEDRTSGFAVDRVAQTVFAKTCCANLFLHLLKSQLQAFIGKKGNQINREQLLTLPIVKDIVGHRRGAKEAFETSAKAYAELCITLGHFDQGHVAGLLVDGSEQDQVVGPSDKSIRFVCLHSRRLLETVGQITSILAWLYGYVANEDAKSVGRLLRNIFKRAFDDKQFDPSPFLSGDSDNVPSVDKHWSLVKLRLILNLDKRAIPGARPMLAESLGVGLRYNAIYG